MKDLLTGKLLLKTISSINTIGNSLPLDALVKATGYIAGKATQINDLTYVKYNMDFHPEFVGSNLLASAKVFKTQNDVIKEVSSLERLPFNVDIDFGPNYHIINDNVGLYTIPACNSGKINIKNVVDKVEFERKGDSNYIYQLICYSSDYKYAVYVYKINNKDRLRVGVASVSKSGKIKLIKEINVDPINKDEPLSSYQFDNIFTRKDKNSPYIIALARTVVPVTGATNTTPDLISVVDVYKFNSQCGSLELKSTTFGPQTILGIAISNDTSRFVMLTRNGEPLVTDIPEPKSQFRLYSITEDYCLKFIAGHNTNMRMSAGKFNPDHDCEFAIIARTDVNSPSLVISLIFNKKHDTFEYQDMRSLSRASLAIAWKCDTIIAAAAPGATFNPPLPDVIWLQTYSNLPNRKCE